MKMYNRRVTPEKVKEILEENGDITTGNIAKQLGSSKKTIRKNVRLLREDDEPIIHGQNGLRLVSKEDMTDADIALIMEGFVKWSLSMVRAVHLGARPVKPLLPAMKKALRLDYTPDERRELAMSCQRLKALIDWVEVDQEME